MNFDFIKLLVFIIPVASLIVLFISLLFKLISKKQISSVLFFLTILGSLEAFFFVYLFSVTTIPVFFGQSHEPPFIATFLSFVTGLGGIYNIKITRRNEWHAFIMTVILSFMNLFLLISLLGFGPF